tara:strand:+ start:1961 stop:2263 length:303 start_codon:yes stop_codon:yes gene_type:complete
MDKTENLKIYNIVYRSITPAGILRMSSEKQKIEAKNKENAIEILRSTQLADDGSNIRIDKIEQLDVKTELKPERKKSILGWVAFSIFGAAILARVAVKFL